MKKWNVVIIGITGNVGTRMLKILEERNFPINNIYGIASEKSQGATLPFVKDKNSQNEEKIEIKIHSIENFDFSKADIALVSAGSEVIKKYYKKITSKKCIIIDNSSAFRKDKKIPLIIPEVNLKDLPLYKNKLIISNPNCSTSQVVLPLKIIDDLFKIKRIVYSTYQSTSGGGLGLMKKNLQQSKEFLNLLQNDVCNFNFIKEKYLSEDLKTFFAFNVIPKIGDFLESGETNEEEKMRIETSKILGRKIPVHANCCRVPVFIGHGVYSTIETKEKIDLNLLKEKFSNFKGIKFLDNFDFSTSIDCSDLDDVFVSRLRLNNSVKNGLSFWCVSDNLRKGAALNSVQIAEELIKIL